MPGFVAETIRWADPEQQWQGVAHLVIMQPSRELLGRKLLPFAIQQYQHVRASSTPAELQQRGLIFQCHALDVGIAAQSFQVLVVRAWMAGSLVLPIQAIVSFTRKFNHRHTWRSRGRARTPALHRYIRLVPFRAMLFCDRSPSGSRPSRHPRELPDDKELPQPPGS